MFGDLEGPRRARVNGLYERRVASLQRGRRAACSPSVEEKMPVHIGRRDGAVLLYHVEHVSLQRGQKLD